MNRQSESYDILELRFYGHRGALERACAIVMRLCSYANGFVKVAKYRDCERLIIGKHRTQWIINLKYYQNE